MWGNDTGNPDGKENNTGRVGSLRSNREKIGRKSSHDRDREVPSKGDGGNGHGNINESLPSVGVDMLNFERKAVYLSCGHTDMRKSINGLMLIVENSFHLDPFMEAIFVFCNRKRDRIKILEWDADGFWLYFKRLEKGHFRWPQPGEAPTMKLTGEELSVLLGGVRVELKLKRSEVTERKVS